MKPARTIAFECRVCGAAVGDGWYRGPRGHAPHRLCLECWAAHWDDAARRMRAGRDWTQTDTALALLCAGLTYAEAAAALGRSGSWLRLRLRQQIRTWDDVPEWFRERLVSRERARVPRARSRHVAA